MIDWEARNIVQYMVAAGATEMEDLVDGGTSLVFKASMHKRPVRIAVRTRLVEIDVDLVNGPWVLLDVVGGEGQIRIPVEDLVVVP